MPRAVGAPDGGAPAARRARPGLPWILLAGTFLVFNLNFRIIGSGDTQPARFLPFVLLKHHTLLLDPMLDSVEQHRVDVYWVLALPGFRHASLYPVVAPVLAVPVALPAAVWLESTGWRASQVAWASALTEKVAASLFSAISVALLFVALRRRVGEQAAFQLSVLYAFGTGVLCISSQAQWQHGCAQLLLAGFLALEPAASRWPAAILAGACLGLFVMNRPTDGLFAIALAAAVLLGRRGRPAAFVSGGVLGAAPFLLYNVLVFGHPGGGYGVFYRDLEPFISFPSGVAGILLSPGRGLLCFCPYLLFIGVRAFRRGPPLSRLDVACLLGFCVEVLLYGSWGSWEGGATYGNRFLLDFVPALFCVLAPAFAALKGAWRTLFHTLGAWSIVVHAIGFLCFPGGGSESGPSWSLARFPPLLELEAGPSFPKLLHPARYRFPAPLGIDVRAVASESAQGVVSLDIGLSEGLDGALESPMLLEVLCLGDGSTSKRYDAYAVEVPGGAEPRRLTLQIEFARHRGMVLAGLPGAPRPLHAAELGPPSRAMAVSLRLSRVRHPDVCSSADLLDLRLENGRPRVAALRTLDERF